VIAVTAVDQLKIFEPVEHSGHHRLGGWHAVRGQGVAAQGVHMHLSAWVHVIVRCTVRQHCTDLSASERLSERASD
jgi:hypothetical protein